MPLLAFACNVLASISLIESLRSLINLKRFYGLIKLSACHMKGSEEDKEWQK